MRAWRALRASLAPPARPPLRGLGLAAVLGAAAALGQAPWGLWWLTIAALAGLTAMIAVQPRRGPRLWLGWGAGTGYFGLALFWIVEPFLVEPEVFGWMAPFALVLMSGGLALFWMLAAGTAGLGPGRAGRALGFALGLGLADLLRGYVLTGFPWALLGHSLIGTPAMQAASVVGPVGLTLAVALAAALPALAHRPAGRIAGALAASLLIGALSLAGLARLAAPEPQRAEPLTVRLIQPNAQQSLKWRGDMWRIFLDRQLELTAAPAETAPDLIVWPETAVPFLLDDSGTILDEILQATGGVPFVTGIQRAEGLRYYNSMIGVNKDGEVIGVHDKSHLVPFGEYIPFGDAFLSLGVRAFAAQEGYGFSAAPGIRVLDLGAAGRVLPLICYEAIFPQDLLRAKGQADWILQVTNDGWFGDVSGPYQHLAQARLRAVEQGLAFVRAANTGVSAAIDPKGRVIAALPLNRAGFLDVAVPPALPRPFYARHGDAPLALALVLALLALSLTGLLYKGSHFDN